MREETDVTICRVVLLDVDLHGSLIAMHHVTLPGGCASKAEVQISCNLLAIRALILLE